MTHPTERLADYVDGSLPPAERAEVDAHLAGCERCRREVRDATRARDALGALEDVPVPAGVTARVVREVNGPDRHPVQAGRRLVGAAAALAAAAALIAGIWIFGPFRSEQQATRAAGIAMPSASPADHERGPYDLDGNYSGSELTALAAYEARVSGHQGLSYAGAVASPTTIPAAPAPTQGGTKEADLAQQPALVQRSEARQRPIRDTAKFDTCLKDARVYSHGGSLIRGFEARYDEIPAYFAILTEGPSRGTPPDRVVIWVMNAKTCDIVAFAQQKFPLATPSPLPTTFMNP